MITKKIIKSRKKISEKDFLELINDYFNNAKSAQSIEEIGRAHV